MKSKDIIKPFISGALFLVIGVAALAQQASNQGPIREGHVGGYMITKVEKVDTTFHAGYSMYAAAWPLVKQYPGRSFQSGLFGTWMFPRNDGELPVEKIYTDVEGGLGWLRNTEYATETPKFIMGGVQLDFSGWANGPAVKTYSVKFL